MGLISKTPLDQTNHTEQATKLVGLLEKKSDLQGREFILTGKLTKVNANLKNAAYWFLGVFTLFIPQIILAISKAILEGKIKTIKAEVLNLTEMAKKLNSVLINSKGPAGPPPPALPASGPKPPAPPASPVLAQGSAMPPASGPPVLDDNTEDDSDGNDAPAASAGSLGTAKRSMPIADDVRPSKKGREDSPKVKAIDLDNLFKQLFSEHSEGLLAVAERISFKRQQQAAYFRNLQLVPFVPYQDPVAEVKTKQEIFLMQALLATVPSVLRNFIFELYNDIKSTQLPLAEILQGATNKGQEVVGLVKNNPELNFILSIALNSLILYLKTADFVDKSLAKIADKSAENTFSLVKRACELKRKLEELNPIDIATMKVAMMFLVGVCLYVPMLSYHANCLTPFITLAKSMANKSKEAAVYLKGRYSNFTSNSDKGKQAASTPILPPAELVKQAQSASPKEQQAKALETTVKNILDQRKKAAEAALEKTKQADIKRKAANEKRRSLKKAKAAAKKEAANKKPSTPIQLLVSRGLVGKYSNNNSEQKGEVDFSDEDSDNGEDDDMPELPGVVSTQARLRAKTLAVAPKETKVENSESALSLKGRCSKIFNGVDKDIMQISMIALAAVFVLTTGCALYNTNLLPKDYSIAIVATAIPVMLIPLAMALYALKIASDEENHIKMIQANL